MSWREIDWSEHLRWVRVEGRMVNLVDVGEGPALLLIHGLGANWQSWLENIPHFMGSHRVIAVDLPGFGFSEMPRDELTIPTYGRWVDALLDELEIESAAIVGNSMGGFVGAEVAVSYPHRVERLVLVTAATLWNERRRARPLALLNKLTRAYAARFASEWEMVHQHPKLRWPVLLAAGFHHPRRIAPDLAWELMRGAGSEGFADGVQTLYDYKLRDRLGDIRCPTLVVWGTRDPLVPLWHAFEYEGLIPECRVVIFRDTGHVPMVERPDDFNAALEDFLSEVGLGAAEEPAAEVR